MKVRPPFPALAGLVLGLAALTPSGAPAQAGMTAPVTASTAPVPAAPVSALVIGIDDYKTLPKLQGAVNDAHDIAEALGSAGARAVHMLLDGAADREGIMAAWKELIRTSQPGDTLVLSYAGLSGQAPERIPGSETDGQDEVLLLSGFAPSGKGSAQRLLDDDLAAMVQMAAGRTVLIVLDTGVGTMPTRACDPRAGRLNARMASIGPITDDALPPPDPKAPRAAPELPPNLTTFVAAGTEEQVHEVEIDGQVRGALSWAFARAMRGGADSDGNGRLSRAELEHFIGENVRMRLEGRQHVKVLHGANGESPSIAAPPPVPDVLPLPPAPVLPLRIVNAPGGDPTPLYPQLTGIVPAEGITTGRLTWDGETGEVVNGLGDVVATVPGIDGEPGLERMQKVLDKWALLYRLERLAERRSLDIVLEPGDGLHRDGDMVTVAVNAHRGTFFTILALAADGTVRLLHPTDRDAPTVPANAEYRLPHVVMPPAGAEHIVVIATAEALPALARELRALDGKPAAADVAALLEKHLTAQVYQLGIHGIYSRP